MERREPHLPSRGVSGRLVVSVEGRTESVGVALTEDVVLMEAWEIEAWDTASYPGELYQ